MQACSLHVLVEILRECPLCGKRFKKFRGLRLHFMAKHRDVNRCIICNREFNSHRGLMRHIAYMINMRSCKEHLVFARLVMSTDSKLKRLFRVR